MLFFCINFAALFDPAIMKRKDIKRGTILVIVVSVVAFTAISLLVKRPQQTEEVAEAHTAHAWSDTLRNSMSALPQLAGMDADIERFMGKWSIKGWCATTRCFTRKATAGLTRRAGSPWRPTPS